MSNNSTILDRWGRPIKRAELKNVVAEASIGGVRSPIAGYPSDGLTPDRLAGLLREADQGNPIRYLELAEIIEERDPHYTGVIGTRKRSVSQIEITVEDGSDDPHDVKIADMVRSWLKRDELAEELFHILDAIGKGYSHTEIIWDTSMGDWEPVRLEWRDPRWFGFERHNLTTPTMFDDNGQEVPYPAYKFIFTTMQAKSGLAIRSGLARLAAWNWMFKAYTQRDWAIFTQTYGQPVRVGKYGPGADQKDRDTLFRAVANIGGDCAAIIPDSMLIEFVETQSISGSTEHYERRCDWLDKQISKAVLGQTSTTDAQVGGLGSGKEHREVQEDIETADCKALAANLNRDLIRPWVDLTYGRQKNYPRLVIKNPEQEDLAHFSNAITPFIDRGLRVSSSAVLKKFSLPEASKDDEILLPASKSAPPAQSNPPNSDETSPESAVKYPFNTQVGGKRPDAALQTQSPSEGDTEPLGISTDRLAKTASPPIEAMLNQIDAMLESAGSLDEAREMLLAAFPSLSADGLAEVFAQAFMAGHAGGRALLEEQSGD